MTKYPFYKSSIFLAFIACFLWSTAFAGIKIGLKYTTPIQFAGIRFMLSGILILPFCSNLKKSFPIALRHYKTILLISLFQTAILYYFFYQGMNRTPAAIGAIIVGGGPLFVALLAHFITGKDPLTKQKIVALFIGFSGIILLALAKDNTISDHKKVFWGIMMLVTGNFAGSYGNILVSQNKSGVPPVLLNALQIFTGGLLLLIISLFTEGITSGIKPIPYYLSLSWLSFLSSVAFSAWFIVLNRPEVRVSEINVWKFIIPVLGAIISWILVAGEKPQWHTVSGMMLIAAAILVIYGRRKKNNDRIVNPE
jgi:drug/metabolite transporter (DMT)-like permease